ncbi:MAG: hypothetical protein WBW93_16425 [Steroidobacteraceae bacterium]
MSSIAQPGRHNVSPARVARPDNDDDELAGKKAIDDESNSDPATEADSKEAI